MCFYRAALPTARRNDQNHREPLHAAVELWQEDLIPRATRLDREETLGAAAATDEGLVLDATAQPRAPARAARPARVAAAHLGQQIGLSASALKKTIDALVEAGRLVEKKKRPRMVAYTTGGAGGGEGAGA